MRRFLTIIVLMLATGGLSSSSAGARSDGWGGTPAQAERMLDSQYETVDPWALHAAYKQLGEASLLGDPTAIQQDLQDVQSAQRAATPTWEHCRGAGPSGLIGGVTSYARFHCTIHLSSYASNYEATKRITFYATGRFTFRVLSGWR